MIHVKDLCFDILFLVSSFINYELDLQKRFRFFYEFAFLILVRYRKGKKSHLVNLVMRNLCFNSWSFVRFRLTMTIESRKFANNVDLSETHYPFQKPIPSRFFLYFSEFLQTFLVFSKLYLYSYGTERDTERK